MNKIISLFIATVIILSCNSVSDQTKTAEPAVSAEHHEHSENTGGLELNKGAKWKADSATHSNVTNLETILAASKKESLESYKETAADLQAGLDKMISECKMKGPDHEALHHWLEPLLEKTKALQQATSAGDAAAVLQDIETQLHLFHQYFE